MDASTHTRSTIDETSYRYDGWRIVAVCFLLATFGWGLGFYGQSVYVAELQRLRGWPASLISGGTTFFYLSGALLVAFVSEAIRAFGARACLIAGTCVMALGAIAMGQVAEDGVVFEQMREGLGIGDVVDGYELDILVIQRRAHDVAADAAEAVDAYLNGHSSSE